MGLEKIAVGVMSLGILTGCASNVNGIDYFDIDAEKIEHNYQSERSDLISIYGFGGFGGNITEGVVKEIRNLLIDNGKEHYKINKWNVHFGKIERGVRPLENDINDGRSFIFVAHSLGCRNAVNVVKMLDSMNVPVDVLVLMDPFAFDKKIPENVKKVLVYRSEDIIFNGRALDKRDLESQGTKFFISNLGRWHNDFNNDEYSEVIAHDVVNSL
ncbi:hypothetical protein COU60_02360 [Candidatus Pacearchaeota archaeon CG10_big_fil_rev_8_21_14_0_10_34_76]|nr:MAG: hypothetical protein COU60_02360 [Candidatus Pacearchaeota archaeon CG10_big_fil_rev_8_21_14_0_10_34_76]